MAKKNKKNKNIEESEIAVPAESNVESNNEIETADEMIFSEDVMVDTALFLQEDAESEGFLPEASEDDAMNEEEAEVLTETDLSASDVDLEGSELEGFESAQIDEVEFIEDEQAESIIESILFASDRPVSLASIREVFKGTNIKKERIRRILDNLAVEYAGGRRGISLEEITGGYQLRTKIDNMNFLKRTVKARPFKLSGPALETLSIVAYKQPVVKNEIDQIRGVESGHLLRALMEKGLCNFEGKAENLPGKPMQYGTTRRFLEIFGLRNIKELPTLSQIDELLPEGIGEEEEAKPTLSMVTDSMSEHVTDVSYSQGEEELGKIESELSTITTSSDFFEQEKIRQKQKKEADKAQDIRDALAVGEAVSTRDKNWLAKYEEALNAPAVVLSPDEVVTAEIENTELTESSEDNDFVVSSEEGLAAQAVADFDSEEESESDELPFFDEADSEPESHA